MKLMSRHREGFALPTILIASIVMLTVMLLSVQAASSVNVGLQSQYYNKLASEAAESGVAYAKACLAASGNVVTWGGNALSPGTDCTGKLNGFACPANTVDSRCVLTINGDVRTTFSVPSPAMDSQGQPTSIAANGIVDLLRTSTGIPWRTFRQPLAAAPATCSPTAINTASWNNAIITSEAATTKPTGAAAITIATGSINPGPIYYRKDFIVTQAGAYTLQTLGDDYAEVSIDGQLVVPGLRYSTMDSRPVTMTAGCHTIVVKVTNMNALPNPSDLMLSLKSASSPPIVATDATWRVTAGSAVHFSSPDYYADSSAWTPVRDLGTYNGSTIWGSGPSVPGTWPATTGDSTARWISTAFNYDASNNYPANSFAYFRDRRNITVATPTQVKVYVAADDNFVLYMDGQQILSSASGWGTIVSTTITMSPGTHEFGMVDGNGSGAAGFLFVAKRASDGFMLSRSDQSWTATSYWSATNTSPYSYDNVFVPANIPAYQCPCPTLTNMATNPSIETGTTNWAATSGVTIAQSAIGATNGSYSLALTGNGSSNDSFASLGGDDGALRLGLQPGHTYTISATVNVTSALTGTLGPYDRELGIAVHWYTTGYRLALITAPNAPGVYPLRLTFTIEPSATRAFVRLYHGGLSGTVYWDSVMLTEGPYAYPYMDGNSPGWSWGGTSGASTSSGTMPAPIP